jgi:hypothetical protein
MKLFPIIEGHDTIPHWWMGIAYPIYARRAWRCAPLGLHWIMALGLLLWYFICRPWFARSLIRADDLARLALVDKALYQLRIRNGDLSVELKATLQKLGQEIARRQKLEELLRTTIHENIDHSPYIRRSED